LGKKHNIPGTERARRREGRGEAAAAQEGHPKVAAAWRDQGRVGKPGFGFPKALKLEALRAAQKTPTKGGESVQPGYKTPGSVSLGPSTKS